QGRGLGHTPRDGGKPNHRYLADVNPGDRVRARYGRPLAQRLVPLDVYCLRPTAWSFLYGVLPGRTRWVPSLSRRLHLPLDITEEATHARGCFVLYEGPDQTLQQAGHRGVRGDRLRESHPRAVLRCLFENHRAADVGVVALDREALEADPVDAVALIARGVAGHHAHRPGGALLGDEAVGGRAPTPAGGKLGDAT